MTKHPGLSAAFWIAGLGTSIAVLAWVVTFYGHPWSEDSSRWSEFGGYVGGTLAPILAFASFIGLLVSLQAQRARNQEEDQRQDAEVYHQSAVRSLERAYEAIMRGGNGVTPNSDRLEWLTCARLLLAAQEIASRIAVKSIREMYEAEEEHWRRRFYDVFDPAGFKSPLNDPAFYRRGEQKMRGYVIDERSIKVIFAFCEWPEGRDDPIETVGRFTAAELDSMVLGRRGAAEFVRSQR